MDDKFKESVTLILGFSQEWHGTPWAYNLAKTLWDAGFRLHSTDEHYVTAEAFARVCRERNSAKLELGTHRCGGVPQVIYDNIVRGLQSAEDLAEGYKRARDEAHEELREALIDADKFHKLREILK